jgi:tetratricopeptide (TPR) repeat protein
MRPFRWVRERCARSFAALLIRSARRRVERHDPKGAFLALGLANKLRVSPRLLVRRAITAMELQRYREAAASLREAIALSPTRASVHAQLARLHSSLGYLNSARESAGAALETNPGCTVAHVVLAEVERADGNDEAASRHAAAAVSSARSRGAAALAHRRLAMLHRDRGHRDDMVACCLEAIRLQPDEAEAYFHLADAEYYGDKTHDHITAMERLIAERRLSVERREQLHFALGSVYDRCGDWDRAFSHFRRGNKCRRVRYSRRREARHTSRIIRVFTRERVTALARAGSTSDAIIFIVGMPRSGTTLLEQLLDTHSQVKGLGERADFVRTTWQLPTSLAWTRLSYPECAEYLNRDLVNQFSEEILRTFLGDAKGITRVVTKRPDDSFELGLMHILFPQCKVIHCRRHPFDTCLSCFMQEFAEITYSAKLSNLAAHYLQYRRVMDHWYSVLPPETIYDLACEELVAEPRECVEDLLRFCGLEPEPLCERFFANDRRVNTASCWQVRRPIYSRSVGRWKNYQEHLVPLVKLLGSGCATSDGSFEKSLS